ncbi:glucans biosynthesis glucosyltransferase MdoH [Marinobacter sp. F4218]|uniref:glucans biosynthesis glucosyltransferase MdoH n=1 Tax=Marinobacter sp. F4218 TaxID=2862868 RepID=UPI001C629657|nr:glucans biosynthesis glucosyltransferase MdoH [Marinobacter sp. F4218]MBW7470085.1 glucans biosynthesis glucosyltransferase MdoH [Marinobacter sp. F4218]
MGKARRSGWRGVAIFRRSLMIFLVFGQTAIATYYLLWILPYHGGTIVEKALIVLFAVLYIWIAIGFWIAVWGFFIRSFGGDSYSLVKRHSKAELESAPLATTAILLPIYHEPVDWTFKGLKAVYEDLAGQGKLDHFEFYILSDSRSPDVWLEERAAWYDLVTELGAEGRIFYRRRAVNLNFKSGNVADFLRRWGRRHKYMVVLDADSLLSGQTVCQMVQLMELEPQVGILQTNPNIINGKSLFARIQQFANRFYSPLFATGLAAVQMGDAAFWGHNAILRVEPFMKHCGLRKLPGRGLFSGAIMSHDFVEAAYMGRAGYEVWLEPQLGGSFEESPPTLGDELARDNRWAKGNLQHLWVMLREPGLRFAHRMAFLNGVMAYLASPLWLLFLIAVTISAAQMTLAPIDYFPEGYQGLFPLWPEWRPEWALGLALSTLMLLFFPKFLAIFDSVVQRTSAGFGGYIKLLKSVLLESLVSVLLAPVRMLAHSRFVIAALFNVSLKWAGQNRTEEITWREGFWNQLPAMLVGSGWALFAWQLDTLFFFWSLPVAVPLILSAPTSVLLSRQALGIGLLERRLLMIPEEFQPPPVLERALEYRLLSRPSQTLTPFQQAILIPHVNRLHQAFARVHTAAARQQHWASDVESCLQHGPVYLSNAKVARIARDRWALDYLHREAWKASVGTYWGQCVHRRILEKVDGSARDADVYK